MFEQASRLNLLFRSTKGNLSVHDLWSLPLSSSREASLDKIAIDLHHSLKDDGISFVNDADKPDPEQQLRFDIVRHIIKVRKEENRITNEARARAEQKQKILGMIARKEDAEMEGKSLDELKALIGAL